MPSVERYFSLVKFLDKFTPDLIFPDLSDSQSSGYLAISNSIEEFRRNLQLVPPHALHAQWLVDVRAYLSRKRSSVSTVSLKKFIDRVREFLLYVVREKETWETKKVFGENEIENTSGATNDNSRRIVELDTRSASIQKLINEIGPALEEMPIEFEKIRQIEAQSKAILQRIKLIDEEAIQHKTTINELLTEIESRKAELLVIKVETDNARSSYAETESLLRNALEFSNNVTGKASRINDLLQTAETAVGLQATAGISAAFIAERDQSRKSLAYWLFGTFLFILGALIATAWILGGWLIVDPQGWPSIVGRIAVVGIMVAGATFCSKQYVRQKSITDDYSYKAVLSQSILAFTNEIKGKSDDPQVVSYLTQVLTEMHKDPQRPRKTNNSSEIKVEIMEMMNKVVDKVIASK